MAIGISVAAALLLALVLGPYFLMKGKYGRLFSDAHFLEIARAVPALRAGALARIHDDDPPKPPGDPRVLLTSAGLILVYTIAADEEGLLHHWSVGLQGKPTASAVGEDFALFVAQLLGVPLGEVLVLRQPSSVHHVTIGASQEAHERMVARAIVEPSLAQLGRWRMERAAQRASLRPKRI